MRDFVKKHQLALVISLLIGVLYVAPHLVFRLSLGDAYRGIPIMQTANEDEYLFRIQEILDGHPSLGSPVFFEYKNQPPLAPPVGEFFYALPSILLGISPATVIHWSRFFLPALLFFLAYLLIRRLSGDESKASLWAGVVGALVITLGYDLVDYRTVLHYLAGTDSPGHFLLWSRPVNPILGALFLFSLFLVALSLMERPHRPLPRIMLAAAFLALMFGSYFFSWGMALSVLAVLVGSLILRKQYRTAGVLSLIVPLGIVFALPYWLGAWKAAQHPEYAASVLRSGMFLTHYPLENTLLLVALLLYALILCFDFVQKRRQDIPYPIETWHLLTLSFLLGGFIAFDQQVITGKTIWPYHFVQYTIPLSIITGFVLLARVVRTYSGTVWMSAIGFCATASVLFGIYTQGSTYHRFFAEYKDAQQLRELYDTLNATSGPCVVLETGKPQDSSFDNAIPAFTHCDLYDSPWVFSLVPEERIIHNYFVRLFLNGVTAESIDAYLAEHEDDARGRLFTNWKGVFRVHEFPDFGDPMLEERLAKLPEMYRAFLDQDPVSEINEYQLDYVVAYKPFDLKKVAILSSLQVVLETNTFALFKVEEPE